MAIIDGDDIAPLVVSQDYKRLQNDDQGPNTGGMGAISPTPVVKDIPIERFVEEVFRPTVSELSKRGIRYRGFLYAGMMLSPGSEASVLEFNCRLGDPETQVLLTRLKSDLLEHLHAAVSGSLSSQELLWTEDAAACVVASSAGYPLAVDDGKFIESELEDRDDCRVFFAGVRKDDHGRLLTKGGRVLAVSALGETVEAALDKAYAGMSKLSFDGMHFRTDIGRTGSVK
jgi:phosphoribosylamine--glycine ligase